MSLTHTFTHEHLVVRWSNISTSYVSHTHWALVSTLAGKISHIRYSQIKILFSCSDLIENEIFCVRCAIVSTITVVEYRSLLRIYYVDECTSLVCDSFQQNMSCIMYNINTCPHSTFQTASNTADAAARSERSPHRLLLLIMYIMMFTESWFGSLNQVATGCNPSAY